jgi:hypothetical protein
MPMSDTMKSPNMPATPVSGAASALLQAVRARAEASGVFGPIRLEGGRLTCRAANSAEPAEYRLDVIDNKLWVSMVTPNRWLSESIETDLLHTGDKLDELIEEELDELGFDVKSCRVSFEHYRSDDKLFTFRSLVPVKVESLPARPAAADVETVCQWLLAYEACFRRLGDMDAGAGEEE